MLLVLVSSTLSMYEMMSCFITGSHIWIWKPITFSWDVALWQKHIHTALMALQLIKNLTKSDTFWLMTENFCCLHCTVGVLKGTLISKCSPPDTFYNSHTHFLSELTHLIACSLTHTILSQWRREDSVAEREFITGSNTQRETKRSFP